MDSGNVLHFIAIYHKEAIGSLDAEQMRALNERQMTFLNAC